MQKTLCYLFALFAITFAFAFREDAVEERPRFARDAGDAKRPFAFAFAKRAAGEDEGTFLLYFSRGKYKNLGYLTPRFARDLDEKSKFAFAFAKRAEEGRRFARDLTGSEERNSKFAFAKRGTVADQKKAISIFRRRGDGPIRQIRIRERDFPVWLRSKCSTILITVFWWHGGGRCQDNKHLVH